MNIVTALGSWCLHFFTELGDSTLFFLQTIRSLIRTRLRMSLLMHQMKRIGVDSTTIIVLSGLSSGFALALQSYAGLSRVGGEEMLGVIVAWGMTRELGPVLSAIMVTGRSGSSIAAELASMKITEQIDALRTLSINPFQYLIIPRVLAGALIMPFLTIFAMFFGILGGYIFALLNLPRNPEIYLLSIRGYLQLGDIIGGLIKSIFFGFILSFVGCYKGYSAQGGAVGVGRATTNTVVIGCVLILVSNYFLSMLLFKVGL